MESMVLLEHVIIVGTPVFDTDFVSQIKLAKLPVIHCLIMNHGVATAAPSLLPQMINSVLHFPNYERVVNYYVIKAVNYEI